MPIFTLGNANASNVAATAIALAVQFRDVATRAQQLQAWLSGQSDADLEASPVGFTATDLPLLRSAVADMNAAAQIILTGLPPASYPQPPQAYAYVTSMRQIIGPG